MRWSCCSVGTYDDFRQPASRDGLQIRSADQPWTADHQAAPGAALPDAGRGLLAGDHPQEPLPELAAGPVRQLAGPAGVPREGLHPRDHGRPGGRPDGHQPVRLLHRGLRRAVPVRLRAEPRRRPGAVPPPGRRQHRHGGLAPGAAAPARGRGRHGGLPRRAELGGQPGRRLRRADGGGSPVAGRDAGPADRVVPRQRVAAGQPAPTVRARRPVRLRLPRPAGPRRLRHGGQRGPHGSDQGLHRPARLDRGLPPRRGLGRHGPDQRAVRR